MAAFVYTLPNGRASDLLRDEVIDKNSCDFHRLTLQACGPKARLARGVNGRSLQQWVPRHCVCIHDVARLVHCYLNRHLA